MKQHHALTLKFDGLSRILATEVFVSIPGQTANAKILAIWDTGATGTCVTTKVVKALGLIPTGQSLVSTANGTAMQNTYSINVRLPNNITVENIVATEVPGLHGGAESLIGMDIIALGDFSITNHNNITCMSFRMPSGHEIDYVKNPTYGVTAIRTGKPTNFTPPKPKRKKR